jgi:hypothetical protein
VSLLDVNVGVAVERLLVVIVGLAGNGDTDIAPVVLLHDVDAEVKVNVTEPSDTPVTTPALVMVAIEVLLLIHVPPVVGLKVIVPPTQTPVAELTTGKAFTVSNAVVLLHPEAVSVNVKLTVPAATPVTKPVLSTVATVTSLLSHNPPTEGLSVIRASTHRLSEGRLTAGISLIVTVGVVLLNPVAVSVKVNVTAPAEIPVTNPALSTVATPGSLLTQVPPVTGLSIMVDPTHNLFAGMLTAGRSLTATDAVVFEQPVVVLVKVNVTVPSEIPVINPALVIDATPGSLLVQVPPVPGLAVIMLPTCNVAAGVLTVGNALMVTVILARELSHPVVLFF